MNTLVKKKNYALIILILSKWMNVKLRMDQVEEVLLKKRSVAKPNYLKKWIIYNLKFKRNYLIKIQGKECRKLKRNFNLDSKIWIQRKNISKGHITNILNLLLLTIQEIILYFHLIISGQNYVNSLLKKKIIKIF